MAAGPVRGLLRRRRCHRRHNGSAMTTVPAVTGCWERSQVAARRDSRPRGVADRPAAPRCGGRANECPWLRCRSGWCGRMALRGSPRRRRPRPLRFLAELHLPFTSSGARDTAFNEGRPVVTPYVSIGRPAQVARRPGGLLVVGWGRDFPGEDYLRLDAWTDAGAPDASFAGGNVRLPRTMFVPAACRTDRCHRLGGVDLNKPRIRMATCEVSASQATDGGGASAPDQASHSNPAEWSRSLVLTVEVPT
jgi:hypothetical protein